MRYDDKKGSMEAMDYIEMEQRAFSEQEEAREDCNGYDPPPAMKKQRNVRYFVDGERVPPRKASKVAEDGSYMADYIYGKGGKISEIHYDRIKSK